MARGITIRYDQRLFLLDENFVVFNPEKKNPYVKHLLFLKVYDGIKDCLTYKSHLKHLRLLKSLDLNGITLTDCLLNETGMLVHLKYLIIRTKAKALPPSFSNLCNLETLVVDNLNGSCMILSPCFWSLSKLRDVRMKCCALFDPDINEPTVLDEGRKFENINYMSSTFPVQKARRIFSKGFLIFKTLKSISNNYQIVQQRRLDEFEQLRLSSSSWDSFHEYTHGFPLSLKKMRLQWLALSSDSLSKIARLPNLQELSLEDAIIEEGKEWNMEDVTFQNLKSLTLVRVEFSEWQVGAEKSFFVLEKLII